MTNIIPIKPVIIEEHIDEINVKKNGKVIEYKIIRSRELTLLLLLC